MDNPVIRVGKDVSPPMTSEVKELDSIYSVSVSIVVMVILIGVLMHSCVDAVVETTEQEEEISRRRTYATETYVKPAAYRLQSPTQEEMDHLHHILALQEVRR